MAIERIHYGTAPVETLEGVDIFRRDKLSYARFLEALPGIIASKFPIEETYGEDVYRLEIGKIRVAANLQGNEFPWIDEKAYTATKRQCIDNGETLSYNLDGEVRLYKNGSLKESCFRHLFQIPAMTSTGSFIINGEEKALKAERSLDGLTYRACGELLRDLFSSCDFSSSINLMGLADRNKYTSLSSFDFMVASKQLAGFIKSSLLIPVNGTNPLSTVSTKTAVLSKKRTGMVGELEGATMDLRDTGYNLLDFLFLSFIEKKEGAKLSENFNEAIGLEIGKNRKPLIPVHPVEIVKDKDGRDRHIVSDKIIKITTENLVSLGDAGKSKTSVKGKTIANYMAPGSEVSLDCPVMSFGWGAEVALGKEKDLYSAKDKGVIKAESGTAKTLGFPDYVPVRPGNLSVVELTSAWSSVVNATREAMGTAHAKQAKALINKSIPRITSGCEKAVVQQTEAALFAKESGKVVFADSHEITIQGREGIISYPLDDVLMKSSTTDMRYTSLVSVGEKVIKGQCIADGPFTKDGELCMGVTDLITALIPFTALDSEKQGYFKGSNNNDALIISESAAKRFERKEMTRVVSDVLVRGWGVTTFGVPEKDGVKDGRFDAVTGLPLKGAVFHVGETILEAQLPDSTKAVSVLEALASKDSSFGRISEDHKTKILADLVVEDVRVGDSKATVYLSFTRSLQCGDKITLGHGQKATVAAILPDSEMPQVEINGKTVAVDIIPDPISFVKRGAPISLEGSLRLALREMDKYAVLGVEEKNLLKIACNANLEAKNSADGMYYVNLRQSTSDEYLPKSAMPALTSVCALDGNLNKESEDQQSMKKDIGIDRMMAGGLYQVSEKAYKEISDNGLKETKQKRGSQSHGIKIIKGERARI